MKRNSFWDRWIGNDDSKMVFLIKNIVHLFGCRIDLHKFIAPDEKNCFHTHPATAIRIVLWGGYVEEVYQEGFLPGFKTEAVPIVSRGKNKIKPGHIGIVRPEYCHRVDSLLNGKSSYSLWLRGHVTAEIQLKGSGWNKTV